MLVRSSVLTPGANGDLFNTVSLCYNRAHAYVLQTKVKIKGAGEAVMRRRRHTEKRDMDGKARKGMMKETKD